MNDRVIAHLPFDRTFGPDYEEFLHKDSLGRGHQEWAHRFGIVRIPLYRN